MERIENLAAFASNWWANHLRETDKKTEIVYLIGSIVIHTNKKMIGYEEMADAFEQALYGKIVDELMKSGSVFLYVDYEPEGILNSAMEEAGIRSNIVCGLPLKTYMYASVERGVSISTGNSPYQILME